MSYELLRRALTSVLLAAPLALVSGPAQADPAPTPLSQVILAPVEVHPGPAGGVFRLQPDTTIAAGTFDDRNVVQQFLAAINPSTGFGLKQQAQLPHPVPANTIALGSGVDPSAGREGYRLTITTSSITLSANTPAGVQHGMETLLQLLPKDIDSPTVRHHAWPIATGTIVDHPRYAYRGAMLDLARHFFTVAQVERYIDEMARFKINFLHLHLSDDQGWRIEIDSWPNLTGAGGGPGTGVGGDGGGFLTQRDYRDIQGYARDRNITVIPEVDLPGHTNAAEVAYPELTCDGVAPPPRTDMEVGYSSLCTSKDVTYQFAGDVIRELSEMTLGPYIHIGGDEAHATPAADYLAFENRVLPLVTKYGKIPYGWHQISQSPAASAAVAQFWGTGPTDPDLPGAVRQGTKVVMSPANQAYLDQKYDEHTRLGQDWAGLIEVKTAYDWNPATRVTGVPASAVLGVEAPLWSETLKSSADIDYMAFPRLAAIAELGWSAPASHSWPSFRTRLGRYGPRWVQQGVNFYRSPQINWS